MVHTSPLQDIECGMWCQCHLGEWETSMTCTNFSLHILEWVYTIEWSIQTLVSGLGPSLSVFKLHEGLLNNLGVFGC